MNHNRTQHAAPELFGAFDFKEAPVSAQPKESPSAPECKGCVWPGNCPCFDREEDVIPETVNLKCQCGADMELRTPSTPEQEFCGTWYDHPILSARSSVGHSATILRPSNALLDQIGGQPDA